MPQGWGVTWTGLTELTKFMGGMKQRSRDERAKLTKTLGETTLRWYQENLSGNWPSTASSPLPVGVVTGDLLGKASMRMSGIFKFFVENTSDHAAYIEFGTSKMVARRPLWDAIQSLESVLPEALKRSIGVIVDVTKR